ncbi:MAG: hypothetical protein C0432_05990 [Candidatus Puniceispirillum sp.]|nr:hypothetical protein [Candidatus Pelagibacter sp.]MBA4283823.1 hypothetical protein [Candidatus Puniceispirillum sp.]
MNNNFKYALLCALLTFHLQAADMNLTPEHYTNGHAQLHTPLKNTNSPFIASDDLAEAGIYAVAGTPQSFADQDDPGFANTSSESESDDSDYDDGGNPSLAVDMFPKAFESPEPTSGSKRKRTPPKPRIKHNDNSLSSYDLTCHSPITKSFIIESDDDFTISPHSLGSFESTPFSNLHLNEFSLSIIRSSESPFALNYSPILTTEDDLIPGLKEDWIQSIENKDLKSPNNPAKKTRISPMILDQEIDLEQKSSQSSSSPALSLYISPLSKETISTPSSTQSLFQYIGSWSVESQGTFEGLSPISHNQSSSNSIATDISDLESSINPLDQALLDINILSPETSILSATTPGAPERPTNYLNRIIDLKDVVSGDLFS